ncbi:hypothetical protein HPT25_27060 [Bacillus sp. BRMEA1]|uniref:hypothetical protein n=1 Tax=Neobacillus endophyticus TaxID=2738405 RepID=UPI0015645F49|nr:hypothetical protein [Neobacillus endophyticus]NRD80986.1 hypothetical protein [Neobacillus endophyticus]
MMNNIFTPMFDKRVKPAYLPQHEEKPRKKRKDKRIQIKVPVTEEEKIVIAKLSFQNGYQGDIHPYLDMLFSVAVERNYMKYARSIPYKDTALYVSTKLPKEVYDKIIQLKVDWGMRSIRQAAHRILMNEINVS